MQITHNWLCELCKLKLPFLFSFRLFPPPLKILVDTTFSSNLAYSLLRAISHQVIEEGEGGMQSLQAGRGNRVVVGGCTLTHCE